MELSVVLAVLLSVVLEQHEVLPEDEVTVRRPVRIERDGGVEFRLGESRTKHPQSESGLAPRR